jgi:hypothetical protein
MGRAIPWMAALTVSVLVTACAGEGHWSKDGVPPEQISADYAQCRAQAQHDIQRDVDIDTDIEAGRDRDWQHNQSTQTHLANDASNDAKLSDNILRSCMEGRGYAPNGAEPTNGPNWWALFEM